MKFIFVMFFAHFGMAQALINVSDVHEKVRPFAEGHSVLSLEGMTNYEKLDFFLKLPLETEMVFAFVEADSPKSPVYKIKIFPGKIRRVLAQALYANVSVLMLSNDPENVKTIGEGFVQLQSVPFDYINMVFAPESICQAALL
jgi:hypothetical protein